MPAPKDKVDWYYVRFQAPSTPACLISRAERTLFNNHVYDEARGCFPFLIQPKPSYEEVHVEVITESAGQKFNDHKTGYVKRKSIGVAGHSIEGLEKVAKELGLPLRGKDVQAKWIGASANPFLAFP